MEIPGWPGSRPLDLADKTLFDSLFAAAQPRISELTFAGLYLFRHAHDYRVTSVLGSTVILGKGYDACSCYFLPPVGPEPLTAAAVLIDAGLTLYGAHEDLSGLFAGQGNITCFEDRDSFDYLYERADLATLPGSRFHKKRNRISYFTARHRHETALFSPSHLDGCRQLLTTWEQVAGQEENRSLALEVAAAREALEQAAMLGLEGVVVTVDNSVKAFALGERINHDTAICHFEKADPFMEGLAQLVNREFSRLLFTDCRYINREQDLGVPGLRNAKLSYHPVELVKKFRCRSMQK